MRDLSEITSNPKLSHFEHGSDGFRCEIDIGGWAGTLIFSWGCGWEHVSVSPYATRLTPSWRDMCNIKDIFFKDDESVIQVHPPKNMYVNNKTNCLHMWRCTYQEMVLPPSVLVGMREGQTPEEFRDELKEAYRIAGEEM